MGKGSVRRPSKIGNQEFVRRWNKAFGKKDNKKDEQKRKDKNRSVYERDGAPSTGTSGDV